MAEQEHKDDFGPTPPTAGGTATPAQNGKHWRPWPKRRLTRMETIAIGLALAILVVGSLRFLFPQDPTPLRALVTEIPENLTEADAAIALQNWLSEAAWAEQTSATAQLQPENFHRAIATEPDRRCAEASWGERERLLDLKENQPSTYANAMQEYVHDLRTCAENNQTLQDPAAWTQASQGRRKDLAERQFQRLWRTINPADTIKTLLATRLQDPVEAQDNEWRKVRDLYLDCDRTEYYADRISRIDDSEHIRQANLWLNAGDEMRRCAQETTNAAIVGRDREETPSNDAALEEPPPPPVEEEPLEEANPLDNHHQEMTPEELEYHLETGGFLGEDESELEPPGDAADETPTP